MGKCVVHPIPGGGGGEIGSGSEYGVVKLSDSITSASGISGGVAATPAAVKAAVAAAKPGYRILFGKVRSERGGMSVQYSTAFTSPPTVFLCPICPDYSPYSDYAYTCKIRPQPAEYQKKAFTGKVYYIASDGVATGADCDVFWLAIGPG